MSTKKADGFCVAYTTTPSQSEAESIAQALIQKKLAACVHITPTVSVFSWKGLANREPEWEMAIKTKSSHLAKIEAVIKEQHSYDLPQLVTLPILDGSKAYLDWLAENTST